jgi:hypothetical protein
MAPNAHQLATTRSGQEPTAFWKVFQAVTGLSESPRGSLGGDRGELCDVAVDGVEIGQSASRPDYLNHSAGGGRSSAEPHVLSHSITSS